MAEFSFASIIDTAKEAGFETEVLPVDRYPQAEATHVKVTNTQGGKQRIGVRFKVLGGPHANGGVWLNQTVPNGSEKNPAGAAAAFLRELSNLGVVPSGTLESALQPIVGQVYDIEVERKRPDSQGGFWTDVKIKGGGPGAPAAPTAPALPAPASAPAPAAAAEDDEDPELAALEAKLAAAKAKKKPAAPAPADDDEFSERPV